MTKPTLVLLPDLFAVARLDAAANLPPWSHAGVFTSITRTSDELSIVCAQAHVPEGVRAERGWRVVKVRGPIPFETIGLFASITTPLAAASLSVFLLSTFDTDYLLLKAEVCDRAIEVLRAEGFPFEMPIE